MQSDADRFRPREPGAISEQSPPTAGDTARLRVPDGSVPDERQAPPQRQPPPQRPVQPPPQRPVQPPRYAAPQYGARHQYNDPRSGASRIGAAQSPLRGSTGYALPHPGARYAPPVLEGRDAPLIHPAAAQVSNALPYGVPVYRAPVYAYAPRPQRGLSITALVLGVCSFLIAWTLVVVPIIGIVFGIVALRREPAGKVLAIIGLAGSCVGLVWVMLFYLLPLFGVLGAALFSMSA